MSKINYNDLIGQSTQFLGQQIDNVQRSQEQGVTGLGVAKDALTGAASGAAIGSIVPGIGTAIGAVGGAVVGGITSAIGTGHGYNADSNSVRFADVYKPGSGIASLFGNSKRWARNRAAETQRNNIAKNLTGNVILDYYNDYRNVPLVYSAAEGGVIPTSKSKVKVSKGELIKDPDTNEIVEVPGGKNKANGKDDIEGMVKNRSQIMSNKRRDMSQEETNAQWTKKYIKPNKKATDKYAKGTIDAQNRIWDIAMHTQEMNKSLEGKPSVKPAFKDGGINWGDLAYQSAALLTPLFDREKITTTKLRRPIYRYNSIDVNTLNQEQDIDRSFALANYSIDNSGYGAGQQLAAKIAAANNRGIQRAKIKQWQTEQRDKNIAQNTAMYNNWQDKITDITNTEIQLNEQNAATARNINRQNRAAALNTWGQINRDYKQNKMDKVRILMAGPMFKYGTENWEEMVKKLNEMGVI